MAFCFTKRRGTRIINPRLPTFAFQPFRGFPPSSCLFLLIPHKCSFQFPQRIFLLSKNFKICLCSWNFQKNPFFENFFYYKILEQKFDLENYKTKTKTKKNQKNCYKIKN